MDNQDIANLVYAALLVVLIGPAVFARRFNTDWLRDACIWLAAIVALVWGYEFWSGDPVLAPMLPGGPSIDV